MSEPVARESPIGTTLFFTQTPWRLTICVSKLHHGAKRGKYPPPMGIDMARHTAKATTERQSTKVNGWEPITPDGDESEE